MKYLINIFILMIGCSISTFSIGEASTDFANCTQAECHKAQIKHSSLHDPVKEDCQTCHETSSKVHPVMNRREFKLVNAVPNLCEQCHELGRDKKSTHSPAREGNCMGCHDPHGSETEMLLKSDVGALCVQCHESYLNNEFIHGPVAGGMCTACHDPHFSDHNILLKREGQEICLFCHTAKKQIQAKPSVHKPFKDGCMKCHTPHNSAAKYLLSVDVPELCYVCHPTVEVGLEKKSEVHGPFQKGGKCYLCHNAHVSEYKNLLQMDEKDLCFQCHGKKIAKDGRIIRDIKRSVQSKVAHEPVVSEGCSACHAAHTPDNFFLLSSLFPQGSYTEGKPENFGHCFDCHDASLMLEEETIAATKFREGKKNLHFLHINREKARNCTTCHDIHGSTYVHLIADKVPFGKWSMPMKYSVTDTGGSCQTGCHKVYSYDRKK